VFVSELHEECIAERKGQGPDVAGPHAYCLTLLEPTFDARMSKKLRGAKKQFRKRFHRGFSLRFWHRAHNLLNEYRFGGEDQYLGISNMYVEPVEKYRKNCRYPFSLPHSCVNVSSTKL